MLVNVCPDDIFGIAELFVAKFGMVMQQHEPECRTDFFECGFFQGQGQSKGSHEQNMTLYTIFSELLIPWQLNLVW